MKFDTMNTSKSAEQLRRISYFSIVMSLTIGLLHSEALPQTRLRQDCSPYLQTTAQVEQELSESLQGLLAISPDMMAGLKIPGWIEINAVNRATLALRNSKQMHYASDGTPFLEKKIKSIEQIFLNQDRFRTDYSTVEGLVANYRPAEYELKFMFQQSVMELNGELPEAFRIKLPSLPISNRDDHQLLTDARKLVSAKSKSFNQVLAQNGFSDGPQEFENFLVNFVRQSKSIETQKKIAQLMDRLRHQKKFSISMRTPTTIRWCLPKTGFQNQHVTGNSTGFYDPSFRKSVESQMLQISKAEYEQLDLSLTPKYGYLHDGTVDPSESNYGGDIYHFKHHRVSDRTTFTFGDSLVNYMHNNSNHWALSSLPVELLPLAAFFLIPDALPKKSDFPNLDLRYIEFQIFGPLTLDDVETFIFTTEAPDDEFATELLARNIQILDGRKNPPVNWKP